jgi:hypothetical protein
MERINKWFRNHKIQLSKRVKSFLWRFGVAVILFGLNWLSENLVDLEIDPRLLGVIVLVVNEATKYLNTGKYDV